MTDTSLQLATVREALTALIDPETAAPLAAEQVTNVKTAGGRLRVTLAVSTWCLPIWGDLQQQARTLLGQRFAQFNDIQVDAATWDRPPQPLGQIGLTAKSVIAVGSGKGGVGKSTVAASIAVGLRRSGAAVGLMDADVYGPSIPHLFGVAGRPEVIQNKIQPVLADGIPLMSMGFMVPPGEAVVWRGPMLHGAITQFLRDTAWGLLDYLIIDMPPGTGDIALTLSQALPLSGAVVVCTPQEVALLDAVKAIAMFRKVQIPVLGMVENMSGFICPDNGKRYDIFGSGGAKRTAQELGVPVLGEIPITMRIREYGDLGRVAASFEDPAAVGYLETICTELVRQLAEQRATAQSLPEL